MSNPDKHITAVSFYSKHRIQLSLNRMNRFGAYDEVISRLGMQARCVLEAFVESDNNSIPRLFTEVIVSRYINRNALDK